MILAFRSTGRGDPLDLEQAQHGNGVQSCHVEQAEKVRRPILLLRRLQLGLEPSTHRANLPADEQRIGDRTSHRLWPDRDDDESATSFSHRGMVSEKQVGASRSTVNLFSSHRKLSLEIFPTPAESTTERPTANRPPS